MRKFIIAAILSLSILPVLTQASTEINNSHQCELLRLGSISVSGGTIDELTSSLQQKQKNQAPIISALLQIVGGDKLIIPFC
jgi:uncharacterized membrane protein